MNGGRMVCLQSFSARCVSQHVGVPAGLIPGIAHCILHIAVWPRCNLQSCVVAVQMSQGKEGAVLRLLKHYDTRPVTQRVGFKLLQPVEHQLHLLRNSRDNISIFLDIINLEMMKPRHKEQVIQDPQAPSETCSLRIVMP